MTLDLLWTDVCFLFLFVVVTAFTLNGLRKPPIRRAFSQIFSSAISVSAAVVLLFFIIIAVLDCIHLKAAGSQEAFSVLDKILSPLGTVYEKTYSAPLSLTLYTSETTLKDGKAVQIYPRLSYPPKSLQSAEDVHHFVQKVLESSVLIAVVMVALLWAGVQLFRKCFTTFRTLRPSKAALSGYITLMISLSILIASFWLSRYLHVLGTGKIGQDVLFYAVKSIRTGMIIGTLTTLFMMPLALGFGIAAGYFGGVVDDVI